MADDAHGNISGKRLVIFGCGYVGSEVAREAISRGLRVAALTRNESKAAALRSAGWRLCSRTWRPTTGIDK